VSMGVLKNVASFWVWAETIAMKSESMLMYCGVE
jgi:hypothetical protein